MSTLKESLEAVTRCDVAAATDLQELVQFKTEDDLWNALMREFDWNPFHAEEIAEKVWVELYAEKEGE